jgi:nitroreductase
MLQDQPTRLPTRRNDGQPMKSFLDIVLQRRATPHFVDGTVPPDQLDAMLQCAAQAPSGYNLQPWRFIVVRDPENRARLRRAAFDEPKVSEAALDVIVLGMKESWRDDLDEVLEDGARRGLGRTEDVPAKKAAALQFLASQPMEVWVTRHATIAATYLMLAAEAYGFATAPMEGFDPIAVKREFDVPDEAEVVMLLAIGRAKEPRKPFPGRFAVERIVHHERYAGTADGLVSAVEEPVRVTAAVSAELEP